jgi:ADP-heptose:LPS heptosyltransferase
VNSEGKKEQILIINLTRMGDLLQMTPFLGSFRREHPDGKITLLVLEQFCDVCSGFPFVDEIETLDGDGLLSKLEDPASPLLESFRIVETLVHRLTERQFDTVINLTFSRLSALLTHLLRTKDVRGITIDDYGHRLIKNPWINHFYNIVNKREINLFNYVDFIRKAGGSTSRSSMFLAVSESGRHFAKTLCERHGISESDRVIGFQPGASRESRKWPTESFGAIAGQLIKEGAKIVLFGSAAEADLGAGIRAAIKCHPSPMRTHLFDMIGKTSVDQLAGLVERCDLLVTGDTGTMHVATAVGTQVVALFFGPAYFPETGPYGEGHVVIQAELPCAPCEHNLRCKNPRCRESITVPHVLRVIHMVRDGLLAHTEPLPDGPEWEGVQLYQGAFDGDGMLEFRPLIRRSLGRMDLVRQIYREMWKIVLDGRPGRIDPIRVTKKMQGLYVLDGISPHLEQDRRAFDGIADLACHGIEISKRLVAWSANIPENIAQIKRAGQTIHDVDEQIELTGLTHRVCFPLTFMFRQGKENLEEGDLGLLSRETLELYETLFREATIMNRGLEQTVARLKGYCGVQNGDDGSPKK